jgi:hypothetical protein
VEYDSPGDLAVGDCYDPIRDSDDDALLAVIFVPCDRPHLAEVFGVQDIDGPATAEYPGDARVDDESVEICDAAFETYVGIDFDESELGYIYYAPTRRTWPAGDRQVVCVVDDEGRPMTGSVKGSRR